MCIVITTISVSIASVLGVPAFFFFFEGDVVTCGLKNGLASFRQGFVEERLLIIFSFIVPTTVIDVGGEVREAVRWTN